MQKPRRAQSNSKPSNKPRPQRSRPIQAKGIKFKGVEIEALSIPTPTLPRLVVWGFSVAAFLGCVAAMVLAAASSIERIAPYFRSEPLPLTRTTQ